MAGQKAQATSGPWRVLTGINYPPNNRRAEPDDVVSDIPASEASWMLEQGLIEYSAGKAV